MQMIVYILLDIIYNGFNWKEVKRIPMLGNRVRELRARFRWTQQDLADAIGVTRQTIGLIEKGDYSPSVTMALKIAAAFQVTVEDAFYLQGEE